MARPQDKGVHTHKLTVRSKDPNKIMTGANTIVELDGKPLNYVTFFKFECKPKGVAKVTLEMLVEVEIDGTVELQEKEQEQVEPIQIGDAIFVLSKYETIGIPKKIE